MPPRLDEAERPAIPKQDRRVFLLALRSTVSSVDQFQEGASKALNG
jgi:hypothetical protein